MTVTAATAVFVLMVVVASFMIASFMMMTTTATAACEVLDQVLNLFLRGFAVLHNLSGEIQSLACQRVVGINCHTVFLNLHDLCHEMLVFIVHQGNDCSLEDVFVIEMSVDHEDTSVDLVHALWLIGAKSLLGLQDKVEGVTLGLSHQLLFESIECDAETCDKLEGLLLTGLLLQVLLTVSHRV